MSEEQLDLFGRQQSVIQRCREKYGGGDNCLVCVRIYAADMTTIVRTEDCRDWCPLLNERIE